MSVRIMLEASAHEAIAGCYKRGFSDNKQTSLLDDYGFNNAASGF
jgi:hypothetical protein